jgi:hypothetical protein
MGAGLAMVDTAEIVMMKMDSRYKWQAKK